MLFLQTTSYHSSKWIFFNLAFSEFTLYHQFYPKDFQKVFLKNNAPKSSKTLSSQLNALEITTSSVNDIAGSADPFDCGGFLDWNWSDLLASKLEASPLPLNLPFKDFFKFLSVETI